MLPVRSLGGVLELGAPLERVPPILVPDVERVANDRLDLESETARGLSRRLSTFRVLPEIARRHRSRPEREAQKQERDGRAV